MILDACCGSQMFYFDKNRDDVVTMDIRKEKFEIHGKKVDVNPDIVGDFRDMPFDDETFHHVIFDPPHLKSPGNSIMRAHYGGLNKNTWQEDIAHGFSECWRVLKQNGTLVFKWSDHVIGVNDVLKLFKETPIYGHRRGKTVWTVFVKQSEVHNENS